MVFALQETDTGLYVSLSSFLGIGFEHLERYYRKTKHAVFLHIKRERHEVCGINLNTLRYLHLDMGLLSLNLINNNG